MKRDSLTTQEAALALGVSRQTLQAWIAAGKIQPPPIQLMRRVGGRLWTARDIKRARRAFGKRKRRK